MKKLVLFGFFIFNSHSFFSQTVFKTVDLNQKSETEKEKLKTLILNYSGLSLNAIGELKDELIVWKEKVASIEINEQTNEFILMHTNLMNEQELFEVLKKYNIKKINIVSYK